MSNIIPFRRSAESECRSAAAEHFPTLWNPSYAPGIAKAATETGQNLRLRKQRREAWSIGQARISYYRAALDMASAIEIAQMRGLREGRKHRDYQRGDREIILAHWRSAIGAQLLTPASRSADIDWKRSIVRRREHLYTGLTVEQINHAIQQDIDFLASHPVRKCG